MSASAPVRPDSARPGRRKPRRRFPAEVLTREEAAALMAASDDATSVGLRNRALIAVMYRSGLRIAEALSLRPMDVDHAACAIRVLWGKGGKARTVGVDPGALDHVAAWAARRQELGSRPAPRCSARPAAAALPRRTSAACCPAWPAAPASSAASTPTAFGTPWPAAKIAQIRKYKGPRRLAGRCGPLK
jgi:integrase